MLKADNIASLRQYYFSIGITWIVITVLILRFFQIQILGYAQYSQKANTNRIRKVTTSAPRGLILDRNGQILVDNLPTYILKAVPGELSQKGKTFGLVSDIIGLDSNTVLKNYKKYYRGRFIQTRLAKDLTFHQVSKLEENRLDLEGIYYQQFPERYFPSDVKASHILGYVKEVDRSIRESSTNSNEYELGDIIGWTGLEKRYEHFLRGQRGVQFYQVDAFGREAGYVADFLSRDPEPGQNIITTIDIDIQKNIEYIMEKRRGVIIVGIPETGEILGAVSAPDYSPDLFTGVILEDDWNSILYHPEKPLVNRFSQGLYPPGSIVKMITGAVMLDNPDFDPHSEERCDGAYQFGDRVFACWYTNGHASMNLTSAILNSCDIYFYKTIQYYELDKLAQYFRLFGFGQTTGVDIVGELKGTVPNTTYMNNRYGRFGWSKGALLNFCIGQGEILVTPMQVYNYVNLLANRGQTFKPHFVNVDQIMDTVELTLDTSTWDRIIFDMDQVITHKNGTGKNALPLIPGMKVYGKTGTAENPHGEDHAWFIGWMEYNGKKYSIVVLLENAGSGGGVAAPVAREVFTDIVKVNQLVAKW